MRAACDTSSTVRVRVLPRPVSPGGAGVPEGSLEGAVLADVEEVVHDADVHLETRLVEGVGHDCDDLAQQHREVLLVEGGGEVLERLEAPEHLREEVEPRLGDVALRVPDSPHDRVHDQLHLLGRHGEEHTEAAAVDGAEEAEEAQADFGVLREAKWGKGAWGVVGGLGEGRRNEGSSNEQAW